MSMLTTTADFRVPVTPHDTATPSPRDLVMRLEQHPPPLPEGHDERLAGYGVIGLAFASGHVLGLRRWSVSSNGPAYTSVWHCTPRGKWTFYADVSPEQACTRYTGVAADAAHAMYIGMAWTGPRTLVVEIPDIALRWTLMLQATAATRLFDAARSCMPDRWLASDRVLSVIGTCARMVLKTGPVRLAGRMPNGQRYHVAPNGLWVVGATRATIHGVDLGMPGECGPQASIGDFLVPRRPLFALATARFDAFDPTRHLADTTSPVERLRAARRARP
ncbi:MAG: hypothetical protein H7099_11205 [Gemmatimonadaceae bacterium]|nr:hypothetical protein [Gemmatimonadaceae bacterium]